MKTRFRVAAILIFAACRNSYLHNSVVAQTDVLSIGLALSNYRSANGAYPPISSGTCKALDRFLVPNFIVSHVPAVDPWGNPYEFEISSNSYSVWSDGADGRRDARWQVSRTIDRSCDIVLANGKYIQYPVGIASPGGEWEPDGAVIRERCIASSPLR